MRFLKVSAFCLICCSLIFSASTARSADGDWGSPWLVSAEWLKANMKTSNMLIIDCTNTANYLEGHIPGAISASFPEELAISLGYSVGYGGGTDFLMDPEGEHAFQLTKNPDVVQKFYRSLGINKDTKIVLYDHGAEFRMATRMFVEMQLWGVGKNVVILNGGFDRWKAVGGEVTKVLPAAPKQGNLEVASTQDTAMLGTTDQLFQALGDLENNQLLAVVSVSTHFGNIFVRLGHLPYSVNIPQAWFFNADRTFKSREEMQKMIKFFGVDPKKTTYTQCGGGIAASVGTFVFKYLLGFEDVKHYNNSLLGWQLDMRTNTWLYDQQDKMRDNLWTFFMTGVQTRTLGNNRTELLDIRTADEYNAGHMPFAINIPYATLKNNFGKWEELAKLVGPAGVNPKREMVVFKDGISKETALVRWMLEYIGLPKVSMATEDFDNYTKVRGYRAEKKPTVVQAKTQPIDMAVEPADIKLNLQSTMVANLKSTPVYPRVFVDSGDTPSTRKVDGEVKHIPASKIMDNGNLMAPPKLYAHFFDTNKLHKLAEVVVYADDPADAALNWFALKQMGYPNVTMLLTDK